MSGYTTTSAENEDREFAQLLAAVAHAPRLTRPPSVGDIIDNRYRLEAPLGRGGMGHVFAARDLRTERTVALKWMSDTSSLGSEHDRRVSIARFLREARIAATLEHPNLVEVFDVNVDDATPYLVMERLRGETLSARLDRGPITWDETLGLLLPAMRGVAALHRAGIVHRDLKPANIFLCEGNTDVEATTKVLDFGISHVTSAVSEKLTRTGAVLGTPAYMSFEQLRGAKDIGPLSDVYALGVVLYEMLSGERPYDAGSTGDHAIVLATQSPTHLAARVRTLSGPRADAVMKALSRDPEARFQSVDEFSRVLRDAKPRRKVWPVVAGALLLLSIVAFAALRPRGGAPSDRTTVASEPSVGSNRPSAPPPLSPPVTSSPARVASPPAPETPVASPVPAPTMPSPMPPPTPPRTAAHRADMSPAPASSPEREMAPEGVSAQEPRSLGNLGPDDF